MSTDERFDVVSRDSSAKMVSRLNRGMTTRYNLIDTMRRAEADHEILELYIESFHKMFSRSSGKVIRAATQAARLFLNQKVVDHFAYEEQRIFPVLLENNPGQEICERIEQLRRDHQRLLRDARKIDHLLCREEAAYNRADLLRKSMVKFFHDLETHAAVENELFPSLM